MSPLRTTDVFHHLAIPVDITKSDFNNQRPSDDHRYGLFPNPSSFAIFVHF